MKTYNLFISHSWTYPNSYENLVKLLKKRPFFDFRNYSVPKDDPVHTNGTDTQLYQAILQKMRPCGVVLILAGIYATYSKWIQKRDTNSQRGIRYSKINHSYRALGK